MNQQVAFRRVRGRVIPIKLNKVQKDRAIGVAAVGAGIGASMAGGQIYKKAVIGSAKAAFKGFSALDNAFMPKGQLSLFDVNKASKYSRMATSSLRTGSRLSSFSGSIKKIAPYIGESLIAYGAFKIFQSLDKKTKKKIDPNLVAGGAALTGYLAARAHNFSQDAFHAGMHGRQGTFEFAKSGFSKFAPRLKEIALKALKAKF